MSGSATQHARLDPGWRPSGLWSAATFLRCKPASASGSKELATQMRRQHTARRVSHMMLRGTPPCGYELTLVIKNPFHFHHDPYPSSLVTHAAWWLSSARHPFLSQVPQIALPASPQESICFCHPHLILHPALPALTHFRSSLWRGQCTGSELLVNCR